MSQQFRDGLRRGLYANPFTAANTRNFNNPAFNPVPSPRHMDENLNVDFGLHKKFKITESSALQLQANAFNVFNRANFGLPVGNLNSNQAGRSIATIGTPRVIQLAIRYDF